MTPAAIEEECRRLGHRNGWRFLACPEHNLFTAKVALITLNPGGSGPQRDHPEWSQENGSAYCIESWKGKAPGQETLQIQVQRLFGAIGVSANDVLAGYFVPFRSRSWNELAEREPSLDFGERLWSWALQLSKPDLIVVFGRTVFDRVKRIVSATNAPSIMPAGWGSQTIDKVEFDCGKVVVRIPHPSQFKLFSRPLQPDWSSIFRRCARPAMIDRLPS